MRPIYLTHEEGHAVTPNHQADLEADPEFDRGDLWDDEVALFSSANDTEEAARANDECLEAEESPSSVASALSSGGPNATDWATEGALLRLRHALGPTPEPAGRVWGPRGAVGGGR